MPHLVKRSNVREIAVLVLILIAGLLLRLDIFIAQGFTIDSDEGIVGIMARNILDTGDIPIFYYGQAYMGTLEPLVVAAVFYLFGGSTVALKAVPLAFSILLIYLTYQLARDLFGERGGKFAALYVAIAPSPLIVWSGMARGGFVEVICLGVLALQFCVRWIKSEYNTHTPIWVSALVLGVGWWTNNQIIFFAIPIGLVFLSWTILAIRAGAHFELLRCILISLVAFGFGSSPFWWYNFNHNFESFGLFGHASPNEILNHVNGLFTTAIPMILGGKRFWSVSDLYPFSTLVTYSLWMALIVSFVALRFKPICNFLYLKIDVCTPVEVAFLVLPVSLAIFSISTFGFLFEAPRYLLPLYPILGIIVGYVASRANARLAILIIVASLCVNLGSVYAGSRAIPGEPFVFAKERASRNHDELLRWLESKGTRYVRTNYWIGYRLAFESAGKVRFVAIGEPRTVRIPEWQKEGHALPIENVPWIVTPQHAEFLRKAFALSSIHHEEISLSGYIVFYDLVDNDQHFARVPTDEMEVHASHSETAAVRAVDGDLNTRWGSAHPQRPGMWFKVNLKKQHMIAGIDVDTGSWPQDSGSKMKVTLVSEKGERQVVLNAQIAEIWAYLHDELSAQILSFPPTPAVTVEIEIEGSHPVFDWSIAEVELFEDKGSKILHAEAR